MRVLSAMRMMVKAMDWVETLPYWSRRGGADHIFLMSHDEGACWAPQRAWPAIMLTHYGTCAAAYVTIGCRRFLITIRCCCCDGSRASFCDGAQ